MPASHGRHAGLVNGAVGVAVTVLVRGIVGNTAGDGCRPRGVWASVGRWTANLVESQCSGNYRARLVLRGAIDVVDDNNVDRSLLRNKFEPCLFGKSVQECRSRRVEIWRRSGTRWQVRRELQEEIIVTS
jgi:hypothetical protein